MEPGSPQIYRATAIGLIPTPAGAAITVLGVEFDAVVRPTLGGQPPMGWHASDAWSYRTATHAGAFISSIAESPGTMVTGIGIGPLVKAATRGLGPDASVDAPSTSTEISSSSSICLRITSAFLPSRITSSVTTPSKPLLL